MMDFRSLMLSMAAAFAAAVSAQDPQPVPSAPDQPAAAPKKDVGAWIKDLGSESYRTRLDAERQLQKLGEAARPALEQAAANADDAEVQWRARRLLRPMGRPGGNQLEPRGKPAQSDHEPEVRSGQEPGSEPRPRDGGRRGVPWFRSGQPTDPDAMREQFDQLFQQFERDFGLDVPRARFFEDGFFRDLQDQLGKGTTRGQGMSMQIGPDGAVKVQVQEKGADGKVETKTYEAPDLETFQKNHPDVLPQNGLGMGLLRGNLLHGMSPLRGFRLDGPRGGWQVMTPQAGEPMPEFQQATPAPTPPPAGKRLGISIRDAIPDDVRRYLELEEGVGLQVENVSPGSLAEALGLQQGDIVTRVGKQAVGSPQDVQQALGPIGKGDDVEVAFVRKGVTRAATAKKLEATEESPPAETPSRLEKRRGTGEIR